MECVAVRAPIPMSRRTRHAHQLAADPTVPPPPPPPPLQTTTATDNGVRQHNQRRMDLEHELKQQLSSEETVHHILERALRPTAAATSTPASARSVLLNIPAFIPAKAKQLLAELVVVEEEIAWLESQIHTMKGGLVTTAQHQRASMATAAYASSCSPSVYASNGNGNGNGNSNGTAAHAALARQPADQVAPEIKSMFFISQALNAEYLQRHLAADDKPDRSPRDQTRGPGAAAVSPKLNDNIFGLPPRNSHDKKQSDREADKPPRVTQEPLPPQAATFTAKRDEQSKVQPNKLSERIVKCLAVIFIRLLRSSRAAEIDKSSSLARSGNLQGSFRIDAALNAAAGVAKEKDRGQQDHYGIFGIQDSMVRDIGPYKNLVRFTSSAFDLRGFSSSPLLSKLREMLEALQQVDLRILTHQHKLAFWLNIYNTCIMHGILQHGLPSNSEKLVALKNKATINVSGQKFNALVIENFILRQPSSVKEEFWKCDVDVEEQQVRSLYGLNSSEPNILFAMCCGIRSSPALRIYKADRLMADLEKAKLDYLQASLVVTSTRRLMIPSLIHCNMHDFAKDMESLLRWICDQLPVSWSLRKSMVDCLRGHLKVEDVVEVIPYDYKFQYLLPK